MTNTNRTFTFHPKKEREVINRLSQTYQILDGNRDESIGTSPLAIYKVTLQSGTRYIVLGREKSSNRDFILLVDPVSFAIEQRTALSPYYFQVFNTGDYRGLLDLNNDRNLEIVCTINGKVGKRIKVYKITSTGLIDMPFPFLEDFDHIQIDDFNIDGSMDIACFHQLNGINQVPTIFKWQGSDMKLQKLTTFPGLVRQYEAYLNAMRRRTEKSGNKAISYDILVAKALMYVSLEEEDEFNQLFEAFDQNLQELDITKKIRLYRMRLLKSYFSYHKGDNEKADQQIREAISYMYRGDTIESKKKSIFYTELATYHLTVYLFDKATPEIEQALVLDPGNAVAQQIYLQMGNP